MLTKKSDHNSNDSIVRILILTLMIFFTILHATFIGRVYLLAAGELFSSAVKILGIR